MQYDEKKLHALTDLELTKEVYWYMWGGIDLTEKERENRYEKLQILQDEQLRRSNIRKDEHQRWLAAKTKRKTR